MPRTAKNTLRLDFETYCDLDISDVGAYRYAEDPSCEVLLAAYSINGKKTQLWDVFHNPHMPKDLYAALTRSDTLIHAFNAPFERLILKHALHMDIPIERFRCTMVHAYALGFTGNLATVGEAIGIEKQKLTEGKELIRFFCGPRKPTKTKPWTRNLPEHDPEKWEQFKQYCIRDVDAEAEIAAFLEPYPMRDDEIELWFMDQEINDRGIPIDLELVDSAIELAETERSEVLQEIKRLTGIEKPNSPKQLKEWLNANGCDTPNMQGATLEEYAQRKYRKRNVNKVLDLKLRIARSSYTKYTKIRNTVCSDGRVRGSLQFLGASRTGRWAGRLIQPQNFVRPPKGYDAGASIDMIGAGDVEDNVMEHLATALRGVICAPKGQMITASDLAGIEGRVLPWECGFQEKLDKIIAGRDMYIEAASNIFHIPYEQIGDPSHERSTGKVAELALGYQGALNALNNMAEMYNLPPFGEDEGLQIVRGWRAGNKPIEKFWYDTERAAKAAVRDPGRIFKSGVLEFVLDGEFLFMVLPSGRELAYHLPEIDENGKLSYMGWNSYTRKWERIKTYGGKLVENATQAIARDVMAYGMRKAVAYGFLLIGSVHDELLSCQRTARKYSHENLSKCLTAIPPWARDLPLNAKGYTELRYKKD